MLTIAPPDTACPGCGSPNVVGGTDHSYSAGPGHADSYHDPASCLDCNWSEIADTSNAGPCAVTTDFDDDFPPF
jgi:hypothetical protein